MNIGQGIVGERSNYLHKAIVIFSVLVFIPFFMLPNIFIYIYFFAFQAPGVHRAGVSSNSSQ